MLETTEVQRTKHTSLLSVREQVHLGNGVASIVGDLTARDRGGDPNGFGARARYCSIHQSPAYPYHVAGGEADAARFGENVKFLPLPPDTMGRGWLGRLTTEALPWLVEFQPEVLVVSAGFDALASDPLAQLALQPEDFFLAAQAIRAAFPKTPILVGLEGGYHIETLPIALARFIDGLEQDLEHRAPEDTA